ncbi:MAG: hypothetical protein HOW59_02440 [Nonomuraea sp.]|nr:hypothetical protein [Nonomuraea sp.]NUQ31317.1 hypothetical protein [Dermatophilaceae bacterium]NUR81058.1 hypothetical protein [Dermatophilaceae bacterium]
MTDHEQTGTPADLAREHLTTIRRGWRHVLDPIETTTSSGTRGDTPRPATEDEADEQLPPDARFDTPVMLAFWVHAALDEWPTILQTLEPVDPAKPDGKLELKTTKSVDCSDLYAMVDFLDEQADRLTAWTAGGHEYGATFVADLGKVARAVKRVAWPPKGDRITIGDCPACGRRVRVKAPTWRKRPVHVPQPTTDARAYPAWAWIVPDDAEWEPERDKPIDCRCGKSLTLEEWRVELAGPALLLTAEQLVVDIREQLGMRYQATVLRQWSRRGMISTRGYSPQGHALYDRTQVLAALLDRERRRAVAS